MSETVQISHSLPKTKKVENRNMKKEKRLKKKREREEKREDFVYKVLSRKKRVVDLFDVKEGVWKPVIFRYNDKNDIVVGSEFEHVYMHSERLRVYKPGYPPKTDKTENDLLVEAISKILKRTWMLKTLHVPKDIENLIARFSLDMVLPIECVFEDTELLEDTHALTRNQDGTYSWTYIPRCIDFEDEYETIQYELENASSAELPTVEYEKQDDYWGCSCEGYGIEFDICDNFFDVMLTAILDKKNCVKVGASVALDTTCYCPRTGCFDGHATTQTSKGIQEVRNLRAGDTIIHNGKEIQIRATVKIWANKRMRIAELFANDFCGSGLRGSQGTREGLCITSGHPVRIDSIWCLPYELVASQVKFMDCIYNIALEDEHIITLNGIDCVTLGHNTFTGKAYHPYWSTDAVIKDLKKRADWPNCEDVPECLFSSS